MSGTKYQQKIAKKYAKHKVEKNALKNECDIPRKKIVFSRAQTFVQDFFKPKNRLKGMLFYQSTGSGKTSGAIYTASNFETDYQILWVTHQKLKNVMWKNIFGAMSAHPAIRKYKGKMPTTFTKQKRLFAKLTGKAWEPPMSYKQFSNALLMKNGIGRKLYKRNKDDPLKNTLVIFDEAHNLYNPNLSTAQKPDFDTIEEYIHMSYKLSKKNSVRMIFLTATPIINNIIGFFKMMNLAIAAKTRRVKTNLKTFSKEYFSKDFKKLTKKGEKVFQYLGQYISYVDVRGNKNLFAQPNFIIKNIHMEGRSNEYLTAMAIEEKYMLKVKQDACQFNRLNALLKSLMEENSEMPMDLLLAIVKTSHPWFKANNIRNFLSKEDRLKDCKNRTTVEGRRECKRNVRASHSATVSTLRASAKQCKASASADFNRFKNRFKILKKSQTANFLECDAVLTSGRMGSRKKKEEKQLKCLKKQLLWNGPFPMALRFDSRDFDQDLLLEHIDLYSPKIKKLFQVIDQYDARDMEEFNTEYKHAIYINDRGYNGVKKLISCMIASGYNYQLELTSFINRTRRNGRILNRRSYRVRIDDNFRPGGKNFFSLTGGSVWSKPISKGLVKQMLDIYNNRRDNVDGGYVRFMLSTSDFLEGVDFYDVKYLHIVDPYISEEEREQLMGRVFRMCGQNGLPFEDGWKVNVIDYNTEYLNDYGIKTSADKKIRGVYNESQGVSEDMLEQKRTIKKNLQKYAADKLLR